MAEQGKDDHEWEWIQKGCKLTQSQPEGVHDRFISITAASPGSSIPYTVVSKCWEILGCACQALPLTSMLKGRVQPQDCSKHQVREMLTQRTEPRPWSNIKETIISAHYNFNEKMAWHPLKEGFHLKAYAQREVALWGRKALFSQIHVLYVSHNHMT